MVGPAIRIAQRGVAGYDFTGDVLPPGATLARGSAANVWRGGGFAPVSGDTPRLTGAGVLIEPAATNLIPAATTIAAWGADAGEGGTVPEVDAAGDTAPDGGRADRVRFRRGPSFSRLSLTVAVPEPGDHVLSLWMRAGTPAAGPALRVDAVEGATPIVGSDWRRAVLPVAIPATAASCQVLTWAQVAGSPDDCTVALWGVQLERGTVATSLATVPRAEERLTLDWGRLGIADGARRVALHLADGTIARRTIVVADGAATIGPVGSVALARVLID